MPIGSWPPERRARPLSCCIACLQSVLPNTSDDKPERPEVQKITKGLAGSPDKASRSLYQLGLSQEYMQTRFSIEQDRLVLWQMSFGCLKPDLPILWSL